MRKVYSLVLRVFWKEHRREMQEFIPGDHVGGMVIWSLHAGIPCSGRNGLMALGSVLNPGVLV